ncbi:MAG: 4Fe-4S binding protein [Tannerella sp.]|jgi:NADH-quinone oxidoreductase subunit I|nr:4Fe-4S binding protein [Tannerella sp.]
MEKYSYIGGIIHGLKTLAIGMKVTFVEFFTKKTTEEYPENRATLKLADRFRGTLTMPHDENGNNKCIACSLCEINCPNGTLHLEIDTVTDEATGKKKKVLKKYQYNLGSCTFCQLCVNVCPSDAIRFDTQFEHAVFDKEKLVKTLNRVKN